MASERRLAFGEVAALYDLARPSYPSALVDDVLHFSGAGEGAPALEVGAGTGKATGLFAARGLRIVALEPSHAMAELARRNTARYENVTIEEQEFERWSSADGRFRLLFSAQAWHWITPEARYSGARRALQTGGTLAIFWNRVRWESNPQLEELAEAYRRAAPELGEGVAPGPMYPAVETQPQWWEDWGRELRAATGFEQQQTRSYAWSHRYATEQYLQLLRTHSDHIVLGPERLEELLGAVAAVLDRHGGSLALEYETVLWMALAGSGQGGRRG